MLLYTSTLLAILGVTPVNCTVVIKMSLSYIEKSIKTVTLDLDSTRAKPSQPSCEYLFVCLRKLKYNPVCYVSVSLHRGFPVNCSFISACLCAIEHLSF